MTKPKIWKAKGSHVRHGRDGTPSQVKPHQQRYSMGWGNGKDKNPLILIPPIDLSGFGYHKEDAKLREFLNTIKRKKLASNVEVNWRGNEFQSMYVDYDIYIRVNYRKKDIPSIMSRIRKDLNNLDRSARSTGFCTLLRHGIQSEFEEESDIVNDHLYHHFFIIFEFEKGDGGIKNKDKMFSATRRKLITSA